MEEVILRAENLRKSFFLSRGIRDFFLRKQDKIYAVDGISFEIRRGEILGLVGESGCGKTTTGWIIAGLMKPTNGKVYLDGCDLFSLKTQEIRKMRKDVQIIFQNPYESLNPKMTVSNLLIEPLMVHNMIRNQAEGREIIKEILKSVGLWPWEEFMNKYPHELSGGQKQRVAIARSIILQPKFIVADEPVSMLDVSIRAEILRLLSDLKKKYSFSMLFITHDLAVARYMCNRVAVMYLGKIIEMGSKHKICDDPLHPYTVALLTAVPVIDRKGYIKVLAGGSVPTFTNIPSGCRFHPRCPYAHDICRKVEPELIEARREHHVACHLVK